MYLIDALTVLLRRWYVVLAGAVLVAGGAALVLGQVPTAYQASGQMVLLLPPGASGTEQPVNPYLNLETGLTTAASLVSGSVSTKDVQRELAQEGFEAEYAVAVVPGTGPLLTVTTTDENPEQAVATRDAVMVWIDGELTRLQEEVNVPEGQYIRATRSSVSSRAEVLPGSKLRALVGVAVLGGILTLTLTFLLDRLLVRRDARRAGRSAPALGAHRAPRGEDEDPVGEADVPDVPGDATEEARRARRAADDDPHHDRDDGTDDGGPAADAPVPLRRRRAGPGG